MLFDAFGALVTLTGKAGMKSKDFPNRTAGGTALLAVGPVGFPSPDKCSGVRH